MDLASNGVLDMMKFVQCLLLVDQFIELPGLQIPDDILSAYSDPISSDVVLDSFIEGIIGDWLNHSTDMVTCVPQEGSFSNYVPRNRESSRTLTERLSCPFPIEKESPLLQLKSYRLHPQFSRIHSKPLLCSTYAHNVDPMK